MAPNFERGILTIDRQLADDLVLYQAAQLKHWINLEFLSTIYQRFTVERNVREKDIVAIWRAICLLVWMQCKQIDGYVNLTEKAALTDTLKEQLKSKYGGS